MISRNILLKILTNLVKADFKTVKQKFEHEGIQSEHINNYLQNFKRLRDQHKIKDVEKKNIDYWGKQGFKKFSEFVDNLLQVKTKTETKKKPWQLEKEDIEGATKVAENDAWIVYKIDEFEASNKIGTRNWCIARGRNHWDEITTNANFYYLLSKTKSYSQIDKKDDGHIIYKDPWHRIAMQVDIDGNITYWNADDKSFKFPEAENIPEFEIEYPENSYTKVVNLLKNGPWDELNSALNKAGISTIGFEKEKYLILNNYDDIHHFCKINKECGLSWVLNNLENEVGDYVFSNLTLSENNIEDILDSIEKHQQEIYLKVIDKLISENLKNGDLIDFLENEWELKYDEDTQDLNTVKETIFGLKTHNRLFAEFIYKQKDELFDALFRVYAEAAQAATESEIWRRIQNIVDDCEFLVCQNVHSTIYEIVPLNVLEKYTEFRDVESDIEDAFKEMKITSYDLEYPKIDQKLELYFLTEWFF